MSEVANGMQQRPEPDAGPARSASGGGGGTGVREVELFVKAGRNGEALGGCPVCQRFFMILLTKAEHNRDLSLVVTTVNPARPPPELVSVGNYGFCAFHITIIIVVA